MILKLELGWSAVLRRWSITRTYMEEAFRELGTRGDLAPSILNIRLRLARRRSSFDAPGCRDCSPGSRAHETASRTSARISHSRLTWDGRRNPSGGRLMDAYRGVVSSSTWNMERYLTGRRSVGQYFVRNDRCRPGVGRTWDVVR